METKRDIPANIVKTSVGFKAVCSAGAALIIEEVRTQRTIHCRAGEVTKHSAVCPKRDAPNEAV